MQLTPFNQGALVGGVPDREIQQGICVALCDRWLQMVQSDIARAPEDRMDGLRKTATASMRYQKSYNQLRADKDRDVARFEMGKKLGREFEGLTRVERRFVGEAGLVARMQQDVEAVGAAVSWTLDFPGGRHAIAAHHGLISKASNVHRGSLHLFDPNIGEYVGNVQELPAMVADMFARIPDYKMVRTIDRVGDAAGPEEEDPFKW